MRRNYLERAKSFIDDIAKLTGIEDFGQDLADDFEEGVLIFERTFPRRRIAKNQGVTRKVFITSDYVIKVNRSYQELGFFVGNCHTEIAAYQKVLNTPYADFFVPSYGYKGCEIQPRLYSSCQLNSWSSFNLPNGAMHFLDENFFDLHVNNFVVKNGLPLFFDFAANYISD